MGVGRAVLGTEILVGGAGHVRAGHLVTVLDDYEPESDCVLCDLSGCARS
jgi:hypothetical protein